MSFSEGRDLRLLAEKKGGSLRVDEDLVGKIWENRPPLPAAEAWRLGAEYTGRTTPEKLADVRREMEKAGADHHILTSLCDIAWLLNVRGGDIDFVPVVLS